MNKNCNDCDIVLELLPMYIEQKTGEESSMYVQKHLEKCEKCQEVHRFMNADLLKSAHSEETGAKQSEKKRRRSYLTRMDKHIFILAAGLVGYIWLLIGIVVCVFRYLTGA